MDESDTLDGALSVVPPVTIEPFDLQFNHHLFLQAATAIGRNKSCDLFKPITVVICTNK